MKKELFVSILEGILLPFIEKVYILKVTSL